MVKIVFRVGIDLSGFVKYVKIFCFKNKRLSFFIGFEMN